MIADVGLRSSCDVTWHASLPSQHAPTIGDSARTYVDEQLLPLPFQLSSFPALLYLLQSRCERFFQNLAALTELDLQGSPCNQFLTLERFGEVILYGENTTLVIPK